MKVYTPKQYVTDLHSVLCRYCVLVGTVGEIDKIYPIGLKTPVSF